MAFYLMQQEWRYYIQGKGPALVFVHGILGFARNFLSIARVFKRNYSTLIYDQRGHGKSLKAPPYTLLQLAEDLKILTSLFPEKKKISFIGHSLGGYVSLLFAHKYPERVNKLIIVDSSPQPSPIGFQKITHILNELPASFSDPEEGRRFFKEKVQKNLFSRALGEFLHANLNRNPESGVMEFAFDREGLLKILKDVRAYNFWKIVKDLKCPTLFLRGEMSSHFEKEDFERLKEENPEFIKAEEISGAGHLLHQEKKTLFIERVKAFL